MESAESAFRYSTRGGSISGEYPSYTPTTSLPGSAVSSTQSSDPVQMIRRLDLDRGIVSCFSAHPREALQDAQATGLFLRKFQVQISFCTEFCLTAQFSKILFAEYRIASEVISLTSFFQPLAQARFCIRIACVAFRLGCSNGNNHTEQPLFWLALIKTPLLHAKEEHGVPKRPVIPMTQKRSHLGMIVLTVYSKNASVTPLPRSRGVRI